MRKILIPALFSVLSAASINAAFAYADEGTPSSLAKLEQTAAERAPLGYAAATHPDRAVTLGQGSKYLNVTRMETVQINVAGKSVAWTFDTLGTPVFPLSKIIPGAEDITVYVSENPLYLD